MFDLLIPSVQSGLAGNAVFGAKWLMADLLVSLAVFATLERIFALNERQTLFRAEWKTDLAYFAVNHIAIGAVVYPSYLIATLASRSTPPVASWFSNLSFGTAFLLGMLLAELIQYWVHRAYHRVPLLWRIHSVHHSARALDWLSGSRQHLVELTLTRTALLAPFMVLGFRPEVMGAMIAFGGLQAVLNHSNLRIRGGWFRFVLVTPFHHHWHHSSQESALDCNFAAHFAFLDYLFGTGLRSEEWPDRYGLSEGDVPAGIWRQIKFGFTQR